MRAYIICALLAALLARASLAFADDTNQSISVSDGRAVVVSGDQQVVVGANGEITLNGSPSTANACPAGAQAASDKSTVSVQSGGRLIQVQGGVVTITDGGQSICLNLGTGPSTSMTAPPATQIGPGASLVGQNLHGQSLAGRDLHGSDFTGADVHGADLSNANLIGANLVGANLSGAHLAGADLSQAKLVGTDLTGADLHGAHLANANLTGADFSGAHLEGADLTGATSPDPDQFSGAIADGSTRLPSR